MKGNCKKKGKTNCSSGTRTPNLRAGHSSILRCRLRRVDYIPNEPICTYYIMESADHFPFLFSKSERLELSQYCHHNMALICFCERYFILLDLETWRQAFLMWVRNFYGWCCLHRCRGSFRPHTLALKHTFTKLLFFGGGTS